MISYDFDDPNIDIEPEITNIRAQALVRENHRPMMVLDGGCQWVLVYQPHSAVSPVLHPFPRIADLNKALIEARKVLASCSDATSKPATGQTA